MQTMIQGKHECLDDGKYASKAAKTDQMRLLYDRRLQPRMPIFHIPPIDIG